MARWGKIFTVVVLCSFTRPMLLAGQDNSGTSAPRYQLIDLGTLGGPTSYLPVAAPYHNFVPTPSLSAEGTFAGYADTPNLDPFAPFCFNEDCFVSHAIAWRAGKRVELGSLDPSLSSVASWISRNATIVGFGETGDIDPLINLPTVAAVLWKGRTPMNLGTLGGGYESVALSVNSAKQVVGVSSDLVPDSKSLLGTTTQARAFLWQNGQMQDLGTLPGGTDAMAIFINERGQIIGQSYSANSIVPPPSCEDSPLTLYTFFWSQGTMSDIGTLGGHCTFPYVLNNHGYVVGQSALQGDTTSHPFLWQPGKQMQDLGTVGGDYGYATGLNDAGTAVGASTPVGEQALLATQWQGGTITNLGALPGDGCSSADTINSAGQIVGGSGFNAQPSFPDCDGVIERAVLWENGRALDLNTLIASGAKLTLNEAWFINDTGEISGVGTLPNGDQHAFVLVPCAQAGNSDGCGTSASTSAPANPDVPQRLSHPASVRRLPRHPQVIGPRAIGVQAQPSDSGWQPATAVPEKESFMKDPILQMGTATPSACLPKGALCSPVGHLCCPGSNCKVICGSTCQHFGHCQ